MWRAARDATSDRSGVDFVARDPQCPPRSITVRWKRVDVAVIARTRSSDVRRCRVATREIPTPTPEAWQRRGGANSAFAIEGCISRCANRLERSPRYIDDMFNSPKERDTEILIRFLAISPRYLQKERQADRAHIYACEIFTLAALHLSHRNISSAVVAFYFWNSLPGWSCPLLFSFRYTRSIVTSFIHRATSHTSGYSWTVFATLNLPFLFSLLKPFFSYRLCESRVSFP